MARCNCEPYCSECANGPCDCTCQPEKDLSETERLRAALRTIRDSTYRNAMQLRAIAQAALEQ